jgi:hypothetical protein
MRLGSPHGFDEEPDTLPDDGGGEEIKGEGDVPDELVPCGIGVATRRVPTGRAFKDLGGPHLGVPFEAQRIKKPGVAFFGGSGPWQTISSSVRHRSIASSAIVLLS